MGNRAIWRWGISDHLAMGDFGAVGPGAGGAWRSGRVGVAHATGICAIVRNISQAWGFEPARLVDLQGLGNTQREGWIRGPSLGRAQWQSCLTTPATSLSCPRPSSRRSPWPSRRTLAGSSGRTSRFGQCRQPPTPRRGARDHHHGAVDSDVQTRPRRPGEVRPSILLKSASVVWHGFGGGNQTPPPDMTPYPQKAIRFAANKNSNRKYTPERHESPAFRTITASTIDVTGIIRNRRGISTYQCWCEEPITPPRINNVIQMETSTASTIEIAMVTRMAILGLWR
jgi:hypothetical protein